MAYRFTQTADELQDIMDLAQSHIATPHSIETSYSKDDYCTYEGALYKALEDVSGAWDASKWEEVTVGEELANLGSVSSAGVELTQAEYDALEVKDPETIYFIKDASNGHSKADASDVAYGDGTVKDALDAINSNYRTYNSGGVNVSHNTTTSLIALTIPVGVSLISATVEFRSTSGTGIRTSGICPTANSYSDSVALSNASAIASGYEYMNMSAIVRNNTQASITYHVNVNHTANATVECLARGQIVQLR